MRHCAFRSLAQVEAKYPFVALLKHHLDVGRGHCDDSRHPAGYFVPGVSSWTLSLLQAFESNNQT